MLFTWRCLFRFRDTSSSCDASSKRYVITNPPDDFQLLPTDQVIENNLIHIDTREPIWMLSRFTIRSSVVGSEKWVGDSWTPSPWAPSHPQPTMSSWIYPPSRADWPVWYRYYKSAARPLARRGAPTADIIKRDQLFESRLMVASSVLQSNLQSLVKTWS